MRTKWPSESKYPISAIVTNARLEGILINQNIMQNALPILSYETKDRDIIAGNGKDNTFCPQGPAPPIVIAGPNKIQTMVLETLQPIL